MTNTNSVNKKIYLIGIDPDVDRCGVAVKEKGAKAIAEVQALHFFDVLNLVNRLKAEANVIAYIDAGWLISKSNWHQAQGLRGERIAKNVGACHQVGKLLCEYFSRHGIVHHAVKPMASKVSPAFFNKLAVWDKRINQDCRDAIMLILNR